MLRGAPPPKLAVYRGARPRQLPERFVMKVHLAIGRACSRTAIAAAAATVVIGALLPAASASAAALRPTSDHQQRVSATKLTWHPLTLINGWQTAEGTSAATVGYAISGGVV